MRIACSIAALCAIGACCIVCPRAMAADRTEIAFPRDPAVIDLRSEFGAKGDGKADDTEASTRYLVPASMLGRRQRM